MSEKIIILIGFILLIIILVIFFVWRNNNKKFQDIFQRIKILEAEVKPVDWEENKHFTISGKKVFSGGYASVSILNRSLKQLKNDGYTYKEIEEMRHERQKD